MRFFGRLSDATVGLLFVAPAFLALLAIFGYALGYSAYMSFHFFDLARPHAFRFVGLENYIKILGDAEFQRALKNTVVYTVVAVSAEFALGLILALALANITRGRSWMRILLILPMMLAPIAMGLMWKFMYNNELGVINYVIRSLGIGSPPLWLTDPKLALPSIIFVDIWATTPWFILLLLAGLLSIPTTYYEVAAIDGAGALSAFRHITLPLLRPVILVALLIRGMDAFRVFDLVYVMTKGGPALRSDVLSYYNYRQAFIHRDIGDASATSWIMTLILLAAGLFLLRIMRREEGSVM